MEGYALLTDSDGKPMQPSGAPAIGTNLAESTELRGVSELRTGLRVFRRISATAHALSAQLAAWALQLLSVYAVLGLTFYFV